VVERYYSDSLIRKDFIGYLFDSTGFKPVYITTTSTVVIQIGDWAKEVVKVTARPTAQGTP